MALTGDARSDRDLEYIVRANVERKRLRRLEARVRDYLQAVDEESGQAGALYALRREYRNGRVE